MSSFFRKIMIAILGLPILCSSTVLGDETTITYSEPLYLGRSQDVKATQAHVQEWAQQTGNKVVIHQLPGLSNSLLGIYQQMFLSKSDSIDIFRIDVIWTGILQKHMVDLRPYLGEQKNMDHYFSSMVANNTTADGRLLAVPFFADVGLLFYRKDLLDKHGFLVPETWEALKETATRILKAEKTNSPDLAGFVWQGKIHEGLTCNALEWIDSYHGGNIIDSSGNITINNPQAIKALETVSGWVGTISPKDVLSDTHEKTQAHFQNGNAIFARNWPYAWTLCDRPNSPVKGKVGVAPIPKGGAGGKHSGTLGGWGLAVSKYSKNPAAATDLVRFMTAPNLQLERGLTSGLNPTMPALYEDTVFNEKHPYLETMKIAFERSVARPATIAGKKYSKVSSKFSAAVYRVISGEVPAVDALKQ